MNPLVFVAAALAPPLAPFPRGRWTGTNGAHGCGRRIRARDRINVRKARRKRERQARKRARRGGR